MDPHDRIVIEAACAALTQRFFQALDRRDHAGCAALLAADGVWERQGKALRGRAAVLAALDERAPGRRTCHVVTNVVVSVLDARNAKVDFCLTAYEGTETPDGVAPAARLAGIRRGVDDMVLTADGWRIARKTTEAVFRGA